MLGTSKSVWGFDPRSVPGCSLWLDGADSNTVTGTTSVTAWNDKSGNGYVANSFVNSVSNPSWVSNVQNGNGVIQYSAGNGSSIANFVLAQTMSIFKVYYPINQNTGSPFIEHGPNVNNESGFYFHAQGGQNFAIRNESGQVPVNPVNFGNTTISNTWQMIQGINPDPSNSNAMTFYLNGTVKASSATTGSGTSILTKTLYINGRGGANNLSYNTYLAELIIYNIGVTTSQRQQIEGYLAWKWGLTTYSPVTPLSIPGCQLWLDGADPAGTGVTPSNGATVSTWVDKSGNGRNGIQYSSFASPTFLTNSLNSRGGISFSAASSNCYQTATILPTPKALFVVGFSSNDGFILSGIPTPNSGHPPYYATFARDVEYGVNNTSDQAFLANVASTPNVNYILTGLYTGSNVTTIMNGGTLSNTVAFSGTPKTPATTLIGINSYNGSLGAALTGTINEFIAFNTDLTTTQRQSIEGYLARKWGLTSMYSALPSIHPFSSIRPHLRTFQPTDIPGCQLWLDGADQSSLVLSGSNVTQWSDKSGNGRNGTLFQNYPTYTTNRVNFNGTQGLATSLSPSTNIESGFVICGFTSVSSVNTLIGSFVSENGGRQFRVNNAIQTIKQDIVNVLTSGTSLENNTTYLCEYVNNGTILTHYLNGNSYASGGSVTYTAGGNITSIGYRSNPSGYNEGLYGYIQEVIIFNTALTTSQRQQIEGYLAHKWGLTPSYSSTTPLSVPGCTLWLDGADPAGTGVTPSNGATVSTWVDKSGNGYNAAASGTMTIGTLNNIPAIVFPAASTAVFLPPASLSVGTNGYSVFFVANQTSFSSGGTRFYSANSGGVQAFLNNASPPILSLYNGSSISSTFTVVASTPFLYSYTISSSAGGLWKNGTLAGSSGGSTTAISTFYIGNFVPDLVYAFTGQMGEFIIYNSALTTTQRQSIEGYLARKWGISISATLPSPHPFKSFPPAIAAHFSPTDIPGCSLWLDAADSSQVTFSSSSNVNTWIDKSGFNNSSSNQSLGTTITYPGTKVNGLNTVNFTAGCIRGAFNGSSVINTTDVTIFIVTAETAPNDNLRMFSLTPAANYQDDQASNMLIYCAPGNYQLTFFRGGAMPTPYTVTQNVPFIYSLTQTSGTGSMWLNGGSNRTASITTSAFAVTNYNIGTQYLANQNYTGLMCEVVVYNTLLNTSQRQKVEGYLAHKWGLTNSLPSKHPYKPSPPIFPPNLFFPTPSMYSVLFNSGSLSVPANAALTLGTNNHTFEFWLYQTSRNFYDVPFIYGNTAGNATNNYYMNLGQYTGVLIGNGSPGGWSLNMANGVSLPALNTWSHYALVRNGNIFTLYLNGTNVASATLSISIPAQGGVMAIGGLNSGGNTISGYMANFRFVNGTAVYTSNFTPPTSPLTAIPNTQVLIQGLVDRSPNAFTVTSTGGVTLSTSVSPF